MSLELIREATRMLFHLRAEEGEVVYSDLFEEVDTEALADLYLTAEEWQKTAAQLSQIIHDRLATDLAEGKSVEIGGTLIWYGEKPGYETCIDTHGFFSWLSEEPFDMVERLFNPNQARKGSLPPSVRDTFFEKSKSGKVEIQSVPVEVLQDARRKKQLREAVSG